MIDGIEEADVEAALAKARRLAERAEEAACKAPPEMARALRRSAHSMVYNLERALEVLQKENRRRPRPPITYS
jgi:hypothetical protein